MASLAGEDAPKTQKAAAEMATALALEFMASSDDFTSKQLKEVCQAIRDCAQVSIKADQYIREQFKEKIAAAAKSTKSKLTKAGVDRKLIQEIIDEHLGVTKS
jgi:sugar-specific transcriptional regulator TrmB